MYKKTLRLFAWLICLASVPSAISSSDSVHEPRPTMPERRKIYPPIEQSVNSILQSKIIGEQESDMDTVFSNKNPKPPLYTFVWTRRLMAWGKKTTDAPNDCRIVDDNKQPYLELTSDSNSRKWVVWMMPVPEHGEDGVEVSAEISFIPDANAPYGAVNKMSINTCRYTTRERFDQNTLNDVDAHATFESFIKSRPHLDNKVDIKYIGVRFNICGYGKAKIRNIKIKTYTLQPYSEQEKLEHMVALRNWEMDDAIAREKDPIKKAVLEKEGIETATRIMINTIFFPFMLEAKAKDFTLYKELINIVGRGIGEAKAAIDANDLEKAELIVEETIVAIKQKAAQNNLTGGFKAAPMRTIAETVQKHKKNREKDVLEKIKLETDPIKKAALEQEALDAKAKAGEGDKQQSEAVH